MARREPLPERPRSYRFALTPLADAMFQLLIFFMLSTSLTPYSLLTLQSATEEVPDANANQGAGDGPGPAPTNSGRVSFWTVRNGNVEVDDVPYQMAQLGPLADAFSEQDDPGQIVIIVSEEARVQDVATALEALEGANIDEVQITQEGL